MLINTAELFEKEEKQQRYILLLQKKVEQKEMYESLQY